MKITLIPTHQVIDDSIPLYKSLGILVLSACLQEKGIDCEIIDLKNHSNSSKKDFHSTITPVIKKILSTRPDVVGFSTLTSNLVVALEICQKIKETNKSIHTLLGGPGVSFCAPEVLSSFPCIDTIIRGESENSLPDFMNALANKNDMALIPGLVYRENKKIVNTGWSTPVEDFTGLPMPAYHFCQTHENEDSNDFIGYEIGRGCPLSCTFCSTSSFFRKKFRVKPVPNVIEELLYLKDKFPGKKIRINHDLPTLNHEYMYKLCEAIIEQVPGIEWYCDSRLDTIDSGLLKTMNKAGCKTIFIGIEAATSRMQKIIKKNLNLENYENMLNTLEELGFSVILSFITGFPGEDSADHEALLDLIFKAISIFRDKAVIHVNLLVTEIGSGLYEEWKDSLIYDGGIRGSLAGDTDIPLSWEEQRAIIKKHPEIFVRFFHINDPSINWSSVRKCVDFESLAQFLMKYSLIFAYTILGSKLARGIMENFDSIELPPLKRFENTDFTGLFESVRNLVYNLFDTESTARQFDAIAQYEISVAEVTRYKSNNFSRQIEVYYPVEDILTLISDFKNGRAMNSETVHHLILGWDEKNDTMKCAEVPAELISFFV
ncbi:MAG: B12-binding domain-containing radical SAM protein [bacterium]|nr:B12-binding domain-containing radical SAM protein [bacterium]